MILTARVRIMCKRTLLSRNQKQNKLQTISTTKTQSKVKIQRKQPLSVVLVKIAVLTRAKIILTRTCNAIYLEAVVYIERDVKYI